MVRYLASVTIDASRLRSTEHGTGAVEVAERADLVLLLGQPHRTRGGQVRRVLA